MAALALALLGVSTGALRQEELECEQAIAHLIDCCGPISAEATCGDACNSVTLSLDQSRCLEDLSCDEVIAGHVCERIEQQSSEVLDGGTEEATVCP